jgi:hypothetical protein
MESGSRLLEITSAGSASLWSQQGRMFRIVHVSKVVEKKQWRMQGQDRRLLS